MAKIDGFENSFDRIEEDTPEELVTRAFSRCQNWPKERLGVIGLAQGLRRAGDQMAVELKAIVEHCATNSPYCPTDADLLTAARVIRDDAQRKVEAARDKKREWEAEFGPAKPWLPEPVKKREESYARRQSAMMEQIGRQLKLENHNWSKIEWVDIFAAAEVLGYDWHTAELVRGTSGGGN